MASGAHVAIQGMHITLVAGAGGHFDCAFTPSSPSCWCAKAVWCVRCATLQCLEWTQRTDVRWQEKRTTKNKSLCTFHEFVIYCRKAPRASKCRFFLVGSPSTYRWLCVMRTDAASFALQVKTGCFRQIMTPSGPVQPRNIASTFSFCDDDNK